MPRPLKGAALLITSTGRGFWEVLSYVLVVGSLWGLCLMIF